LLEANATAITSIPKLAIKINLQPRHRQPWLKDYCFLLESSRSHGRI